jgi:hypothetical protein
MRRRSDEFFDHTSKIFFRASQGPPNLTTGGHGRIEAYPASPTRGLAAEAPNGDNVPVAAPDNIVFNKPRLLTPKYICILSTGLTAI